MSEFRQNLVSGEWVIIAADRAQRPHDWKKDEVEARDVTALPAHKESCPFCTDNEGLTPPEEFRLPNEGPWQTRVVPNKFGALKKDAPLSTQTNDFHRAQAGVGIHEVIVEHPRHNICLALMTTEEVTTLITTYRYRILAAYTDPRIQYVILFKNHGVAAGTSLEHPHSQLIGMPLIPHDISLRLKNARRYYADHGACLFCTILQKELEQHVRIVHETDHFVSFVPYAASAPYHLWIFPRRHSSLFVSLTEDETSDLASNLKTTLMKLYVGLNNPDYNFMIRTVPAQENETPYFHWYMSIIPRMTTPAGFEIGSGMYINSSLPEASADFLRSVTI